MPQMNNRRTFDVFTTTCALALTSVLHGQAANEYDADADGSFSDQSNWSTGGPDTWPDQNVDGDIEFDILGGSNITISGIDLAYTGITDLITSDDGAFSQLVLEGTGSLHFSNPNGPINPENGLTTVTITPGSGLTLAIDTFIDGNLTIDTTKITNGAAENVSIEELMALSSPNALLLIYGTGGVVFQAGSTLEMNGTIQVGTDNDGDPITGNLAIFDDQTLVGAVGLIIEGRTGFGVSRVVLGDAVIANQEFTLHGLSGNGILETNSANLTLLGGNTSNFGGTLALDGDLTLSGQGTVLNLVPTPTADSPFITTSVINGNIEVSNGAQLFLGPNLIFGTENIQPTINDLNLILNGGYFGGNAQVGLSADFPNPNLQLNSGWLVGGDFNTGEGSLDFTAGGFGLGNSIFTNQMGIWATYDHALGRTNTEAYINSSALISFAFQSGASIHVNLIEQDQWMPDNIELLILENSSPFPDTFFDLTGGNWNGTTSLVTRQLELFTDTNDTGFNQLFATIVANYAAPAAGLSNLGQTLNGLIDQATIDPNSQAGELLNYLDQQATSMASYRNALSGLLPNSQFTADRITADNMYSGVARRNIRELAIGTRGPGMIRASQLQNPILLAALQEEDAVSATNTQPDLLEPPKIIIQTPNASKKNDDVFQALFGEGYGRWNDMDSVGFVAGYSARTVGVTGGWGVGLADGVTVGITAGWENTMATMNENLGDVSVNSFRGTPFISWSDSDGEIERYAMFSVGGGYNTSNGDQRQKAGALTTDYSFDMTGWEVDIEAAVGTRVPMSRSFAIQPEASIRYTMLNYSGTNTDQVTNLESDYKGDDFQFITGRLGFGMEWLLDPFSRFTASLGWQGQYLDYGSAEFMLPGGLGMTSQDGGDGSVNQFYVGTQLLFNPNWNTAISIGYEGAFGDGVSNAFTGSLILRF